jgi:hypothetical protein
MFQVLPLGFQHALMSTRDVDIMIYPNSHIIPQGQL